jgi:hypothetical protein
MPDFKNRPFLPVRWKTVEGTREAHGGKFEVFITITEELNSLTLQPDFHPGSIVIFQKPKKVIHRGSYD